MKCKYQISSNYDFAGMHDWRSLPVSSAVDVSSGARGSFSRGEAECMPWVDGSIGEDDVSTADVGGSCRMRGSS